jgi:hypothetical protein
MPIVYLGCGSEQNKTHKKRLTIMVQFVYGRVRVDIKKLCYFH